MKRYDFIFTGGGLAGLSLAYHLAQGPLRDCSMLILDRSAKTRNDRTWAFWTDRPTPFDGIVGREWGRIRFAAQGFETDLDLGRYRYKVIRGEDFYRFVRTHLSTHANVEFAQATVEQVKDGAGAARVVTDGSTYEGRWVFDSRFNLPAFEQTARRCRHLAQHFRGWQIETAEDVFNPETATLLDFRTPQRSAVRFFYVLPFSRREALVEYVTSDADLADAALKTYVEQVLAIREYRIVAREGGASPMSDYVFPRRAGRRVMNIGTRGGRIKPSTGYAFLRIQQDSAAIVRSLIAHGHPFAVPPDSRRYRLYDTLMLEVMQRHGERVEPIFVALFKNNPIERVLRFLEERGSLPENMQLIATLPPGLFLEALLTTGLDSFTDRKPTIERPRSLGDPAQL